MDTLSYKLNIKIYWGDFITSFLLFLCFFYLVITTGNLLTFIFSSIFLYRVGAFTHEIAHQQKNPKLKLFKKIWNLTAGCLMLQPSLRFTIPHLQHHTTGIFATKKDPQYPLIFSDSTLAFVVFVLLPFLLPLYNLLLVFWPVKNNSLNWLVNKTIYNDKEEKEIKKYEIYYVIMWTIIFVLVPELILNFYIVSVGAWLLSVLRIPLEHPLLSYKEFSVSKDQELLSYTHTNILYVIIQPLGLRFHKKHHMFPKLPYYELRKKNTSS